MEAQRVAQRREQQEQEVAQRNVWRPGASTGVPCGKAKRGPSEWRPNKEEQREIANRKLAHAEAKREQEEDAAQLKKKQEE